MIGKTRPPSPAPARGSIATEAPRGILHRLPDVDVFERVRYAPGEALVGVVAHFWSLRWDLRGRADNLQETLPHPNVYLVFEDGAAAISGPHTARFTRTLCGLGRVFGVKFRPGGLRPFVDEPVSAFADSVRPAGEVFGDAIVALEDEVHGLDDDAERVERVARFLLARLPPIEPALESAIERAAALVAAIEQDRGITRVDDLVDRCAIGKRALQRLFGEYVGVGPKWVINRYRLHEAIERLQSDTRIDWAALALDLGYFDQAHFIRDFKHLIGHTPTDYVRRLRAQANAPCDAALLRRSTRTRSQRSLGTE